MKTAIGFVSFSITLAIILAYWTTIRLRGSAVIALAIAASAICKEDNSQ